MALITNSVLPFDRRAEVMKMAHDTAGCHLGAKKTKEKIKFSFTWPTIASDVQKCVNVVISVRKGGGPRCMIGLRSHRSIPRDEVPFDCLVMDCIDTFPEGRV